jgi:hypothetical protein
VADELVGIQVDHALVLGNAGLGVGGEGVPQPLDGVNDH